MNSYEIKVILNVIAKDDETAIEKAHSDIKQNDTEIDSMQIISSEIYS